MALGNANMCVQCAPVRKTSKVVNASSGEGLRNADKITKHTEKSSLIARQEPPKLERKLQCQLVTAPALLYFQKPATQPCCPGHPAKAS